MGVPISIRLDDEVRDELEVQARARGIGLATLIRELAAQAARQSRRARIRSASETVGRHAAESAQAGAFYADWGTPRSNEG